MVCLTVTVTVGPGAFTSQRAEVSWSTEEQQLSGGQSLGGEAV